MEQRSNYIVQYVGFKTDLQPNDFIARWAPFATGFKNAGIRTIDLYTVLENDFITFISRNVWDHNTYFKNFPSGIAGAGSGGGIKVIQFGGYWLQPDHLFRQDKMIVAFLTEEVEKTNSSQIARLRCSDAVPYKQMLEMLPTIESSFSLQLHCEHLKHWF